MIAGAAQTMQGALTQPSNKILPSLGIILVAGGFIVLGWTIVKSLAGQFTLDVDDELDLGERARIGGRTGLSGRKARWEGCFALKWWLLRFSWCFWRSFSARVSRMTIHHSGSPERQG